ncbi:directed DNA/RNA polymerase mu [Seminavis robusta]|uniref:DNA polymerase n=1 Tax=Seminavis robusta TaxID=568900 RepID=A0A9N8DMU0_9STRA|nr:directed DNA/RNA polymerase mu [Seminavis robusta]|eukprot:Sro247_g098160.1 directed DNA/RNA polymerase mu (611) ;mRNA; r:60387-62851
MDMDKTASRDGSIGQDDDRKIRLFVLKWGTAMPQSRIDSLVRTAQDKGATVVSDFAARLTPAQRKVANKKTRKRQRQLDRIPLPTHLVLDESLTMERAAQVLQFASVDDFSEFLHKHQIQCALPTWITRTKGKLPAQLPREHRWWKINLSSPSKRQKYSQSSQQTSTTLSQLQQQPAAKEHEESDEEEANPKRKNGGVFPNNFLVMTKLRELSRLHQKCPLLKEDVWRGYTYDRAAGRIQNLDFEVTLDPTVQSMIARIHGIGPATQDKICQILQTGTIDRIQEFQKSPERNAMKVMMAIWGVGRVLASQLVQVYKFQTIQDVCHALATNRLEMERNQRIGVDCHQDFKDHMDRSEVEEIGKIIETAMRRHFNYDSNNNNNNSNNPLEITIMGSYRRGKAECGDVDVLITHKDYVKTVPETVLGEMVEELLDEGHMAYHLTFIAGMKLRSKDNGDYCKGGYNADDGDKVVQKSSTTKKHAGSSYMGVFYSPKVPGRRRRVDIKFYPFRERAFAWIHFTGCGFFNRSIRLYAEVKKGLKLSDHGLYNAKECVQERVLEASTERDIFDYLGLEYKEPHERDSHDAVVFDDGLGETAAKSKFLADVDAYDWID